MFIPPNHNRNLNSNSNWNNDPEPNRNNYPTGIYLLGSVIFAIVLANLVINIVTLSHVKCESENENENDESDDFDESDEAKVAFLETSEEPSLMDAVEESRKKYNIHARNMADQPNPNHLTSDCTHNWGIYSCASTVWWMCNNADVCSRDSGCKQFCKKVQTEIQKLPTIQPQIAVQTVANIDLQNQAIAAAQLCVKDYADPACPVALRFICGQNNIHAICEELTKKLKLFVDNKQINQ